MEKSIINFNNQFLLSRYIENKEDLKQTIKNIFETTYSHLKLNYSFRVNISFVGEKVIKALNLSYRNVNKITDVLSFPLVCDYDDFESEKDKNGIVDLGDIVINLKRAKNQSIEYNHSTKREICFLCLHGLLHLLGYDHIKQEDEKIMFPLQNSILNMAGVNR